MLSRGAWFGLLADACRFSGSGFGGLFYDLEGLGFRKEGCGVLPGASVRREHRIGGSFTKSGIQDQACSYRNLRAFRFRAYGFRVGPPHSKTHLSARETRNLMNLYEVQALQLRNVP